MDFQLTQEDGKAKKSFSKLCDRTLKQDAGRVDEQAAIPDSHWNALREAGYLGLGFDEQYGGGQQPLPFWAVMGEQVARCCASTFASVAVSSQVFGAMIALYGSDAQKAKYLPGLCDGSLKAAVAVTDTKTETDSDPGRTIALPTDDGFLLSGTKPYVLNGPFCDAVLVLGWIDGDSTQPLLLIVDPNAGQVGRQERQLTMGARGIQIGSMTFDRCAVLNAQVLKVDPERLSELSCLAWAVFGVGVGQAAIDQAIEYATHRKVFGKRLSKHQEVHMKIAEMHMYTDTARLLCWKAAWLIQEGLPNEGTAASAKVLATESAVHNAHKALQIHGGKGYFQKETVERLYRDARLGELVGESSETLRIALAGALLEPYRS